VIHFANDCATLLTAIKTLPIDVVGVDWRIPLDVAAMVVGPEKALQGTWTLRCSSTRRRKIDDCVRDVLRRGEKASSHIFNLGHGILRPPTRSTRSRWWRAVHRLGRKV